MDEPIWYRPRPRPEAPQQKRNPCMVMLEMTLSWKYSDAVKNDDIDEFFRIIKDPGFEEKRSVIRADTVFQYDALQIGIAVLNGQTKGLIDMEDVLGFGMTPLHYAALTAAPRLTNYLIERGDNVDVLCDFQNFKQATPLDLAINNRISYWQQESLFQMLFWMFQHQRSCLEVMRLLVKNTSNKERVCKSLIQYALKGQLNEICALFLAAPELFLCPYFVSMGGGLSSYSVLYLASNSLEKRTPFVEGLSLLLDVFATVGDKLVAYVRLEETSDQIVQKAQVDIGYLLREVTHKKLGVSSPDYYFRFFKPLRPTEADQQIDSGPPIEDMIPGGDDPGPWMFTLLPDLLKRKDIDQAYIYGLLPGLYPDDEDCLNRAIEKKLSSMPTFKSCQKDVMIKSKKEEKHLPQGLPFLIVRNSVRSLPSFSAGVVRAKSWFHSKSTPKNTSVNQVMRETKLPSFLSSGKLFSFFMKVKQLIK